MQSKTLKIDGMTCVSCENRIERKLHGTKGITNAKVSYSSGTANITYDENLISNEKIIAIIEQLDYNTIRTAFNTCQVCYSSGRGYYVQEGNVLVCQNCGNRFGMLR